MRLRVLLPGGFIAYGIFLLLGASRLFGDAMTTATYAMGGASILIALSFLTHRCYALNVMMSVYVASKFFLHPWLNRLPPLLSPTRAIYTESLIGYYNPETATRVCLLLFLSLLGWFVGLMFAPRTSKGGALRVPRVFSSLDGLIRERPLGFWLMLGLFLAVQGRQVLLTSWSAIQAGEGEGAPLFGLLAPAFIVMSCWFAFLQRAILTKKQRPYALLVPVAALVALRTFGGARAALFSIILLGSFYVVALKGKRFKVTLRAAAATTAAVSAVLVIGLWAQSGRFLWTSGATASEVAQAIVQTVEGRGVGNDGLFRIVVLTERLADLKGPFAIINDQYVYKPWPYVRPSQVVMRTINALVPGDPFAGVLSINQLFDWIYEGREVAYNSEYWSILGTLYLYFGFYGTPLMIGGIAFLLAAWVYDRAIATCVASPSFAAFALMLVWEVIGNGTFERNFTENVVRVFLVSWIFCHGAWLLSPSASNSVQPAARNTWGNRLPKESVRHE